MTTVFVAGSLKIKHLHAKFVDRLKSVMEAGHSVVIGDANGADKAIQEVFFDNSYSALTVYCTGDEPRNNVGGWPVHSVRSNAPAGTKEFFTAKDVEMAHVADFGLMIWDTKSTGTLKNIIELLSEDKVTAVFVNKTKTFVNIQDGKKLAALTTLMSDRALEDAEDKLKLSKAIRDLSEKQLGLNL